MSSRPPHSTLIILDLPPKSLCGVDLLSFTTSPAFHGIKLLPPGWHLLYAGTTASLSLRHAVWFEACGPNSADRAVGDAGELLVKQWDTKDEELRDADPDKLLYWRANIGRIWESGLTPYRQSVSASSPTPTSTSNTTHADAVEQSNDWTNLTTHITAPLLTRILGPSLALTSTSSSARDREDIANLPLSTSAFDKEQELSFLPIDLKRSWRPEAIGRERTEGAQDRSWLLGNLITTHCGGEEGVIIGELQFCFVSFIAVGNWSCFEQWKRIVGLLATCQSAILEREGLFVEVLRVLRLHIAHFGDVEGGMLEIVGGEEQVRAMLWEFRRNIGEVFREGRGVVVEEWEEMERFLKRELEWDMADEYVRRRFVTLEDGRRVEIEGGEDGEDDGEYAPVIVDMGEAATRTP